MATVSEICGPPWRRARPNQQEREKDTTTLPNKIVRTQAYRKAIELVHAQIIHTSRVRISIYGKFSSFFPLLLLLLFFFFKKKDSLM